jgi:hypothetical protein
MMRTTGGTVVRNIRGIVVAHYLQVPLCVKLAAFLVANHPQMPHVQNWWHYW